MSDLNQKTLGELIDMFNDRVMESKPYNDLCSELHVKYRDQMIDNEYSEAYWNEFNQRYNDLIQGIIKGTIKI